MALACVEEIGLEFLDAQLIESSSCWPAVSMRSNSGSLSKWFSMELFVRASNEQDLRDAVSLQFFGDVLDDWLTGDS